MKIEKGMKVEIFNSTIEGRVFHEGTATIVSARSDGFYAVRFKGERHAVHRRVIMEGQDNPKAWAELQNRERVGA